MATEQYLADRLCHRQWVGVLEALAAEFNEYLSPEDLSDMMARVGERFAEARPLQGGDTLTDLVAAMNAIWSDMDWGVARLDSQDDQLLIEHDYSPLAAAFGAQSVEWSGAFLRGVYQQWMRQAGAGDDLELTQLTAPDDWGCVTFRLGV